MRVDFSPDRRLFPFESRWFDGAGPRIHYVDEGSGTPVVMFHGNPTWSFLYRKVILLLRDRCRCIAMDYPGFGLSDRPEGYSYTVAEHAEVIGKLVDSLNLEGFIVMGQDWGGAHRYDHRVGSRPKRSWPRLRQHAVLAGRRVARAFQPDHVQPTDAVAHPQAQFLRQLHHAARGRKQAGARGHGTVPLEDLQVVAVVEDVGLHSPPALCHSL